MATTAPRTLASLPVSTNAPLWSASVPYSLGNLVRYTSTGGFSTTANYVSIQAGTGQTPKNGNVVNTAYWKVVKDGEPWWDVETTYYPGDIVSYTTSGASDPVLYMALLSGAGQAPSSLSIYWKAVSGGGSPSVAGVESLNTKVGALTLAGGTGVSVDNGTPSQILVSNEGVLGLRSILRSIGGMNATVSNGIFSLDLKELQVLYANFPEWDNTLAYSVGQPVQLTGGSIVALYVCWTATTAGTAPSNNSFWLPLGFQGSTGTANFAFSSGSPAYINPSNRYSYAVVPGLVQFPNWTPVFSVYNPLVQGLIEQPVYAQPVLSSAGGALIGTANVLAPALATCGNQTVNVSMATVGVATPLPTLGKMWVYNALVGYYDA